MNNLISVLMISKQNPLYEVRSLMHSERKTLESYNAGIGREGLIWVWILCQGVGYLYPRDNTLRKTLEGNFILSYYYFYCIYRRFMCHSA